MYRFATRNIGQGARGAAATADRKVLRKLHQTMQKITEDFETPLALQYVHRGDHGAGERALCRGRQHLGRRRSAGVLEKLALMLAPFAPYVAQEIWEEIGKEGPVFRQSWPAFDPELAKEDEAEIVVQVNGKLRSRIYAAFGTPKRSWKRRRWRTRRCSRFSTASRW